GAISELVRLVLKKDFPDLDTEDVRVIVVEGSGGILSGFPKRLATRAIELLRAKSVEVRLNAHVAALERAGESPYVALKSGDRIPACTLIWAAGVRARPL